MAQPTVARLERRSLAMKAEATYGTDVFAGTVVAADIQEVFNVTWVGGPQNVDIPVMGGILGSLGSVGGVRVAQVTCDAFLRGAGAAYSASVKPAADLALRGCGLLATGTFTVGLEKWVYTPRSSAFEAMTLYVMQENAPTVKLAGCFGDVGLTYQVGRPVLARFTFTGIYLTETDTPVLVTKTVSPTPPWPMLLSAAATLDAYSPNLSQITLAVGNQLDVQESANAASGIAGVLIGARRSGGTVDPEQVTRAVYDFIAKWEAVTTIALLGNTNGAQYARHKLSVPKAIIRARGHQSRGIKATYGVTFDALPTASDDEFTITFD